MEINANIKTPEVESETPTWIQAVKGPPFSNGVLKRHQLYHQHYHPNQPPPVVVIYRECLKNHAASLGAHTLDGCGEFMPSPSATPLDPTSLKCAACGCHRNFHRREPEDPNALLNHKTTTTTTNNKTSSFVEYQSHHRHHPPPPPARAVSPNNSPSPPPISSAYFPASGPHMLLALSAGQHAVDPGHGQGQHHHHHHPPALQQQDNNNNNSSSSSRKRFRTKFSGGQKEKMYEFAERVGWKIQKRDETAIAEFCSEIGVERGVLKVWMHNNKTTLGSNKRQNIINTTSTNNINNIINTTSTNNINNNINTTSTNNLNNNGGASTYTKIYSMKNGDEGYDNDHENHSNNSRESVSPPPLPPLRNALAAANANVSSSSS